jgi:hypothetical protein
VYKFDVLFKLTLQDSRVAIVALLLQKASELKALIVLDFELNVGTGWAFCFQRCSRSGSLNSHPSRDTQCWFLSPHD